LVKKFGLRINPDLEEKEKPLFRNGKWIGQLRGFRSKKAEDLIEICRLYGRKNVEPNLYEGDEIDGVVTSISTYGAANGPGAANTITRPNLKKLVIWDEETNAWIIPVDCVVRDIYGKKHDEVIPMMLGFDNLTDQVLVQYGNKYFDKENAARRQQALDERNARIDQSFKMEVD
jgi:hypothetical protein